MSNKENLEYTYVYMSHAKELTKEVNKLVKLGWEVSGDASISIGKHQGVSCRLLQRMVRINE